MWVEEGGATVTLRASGSAAQHVGAVSTAPAAAALGSFARAAELATPAISPHAAAAARLAVVTVAIVAASPAHTAPTPSSAARAR